MSYSRPNPDNNSPSQSKIPNLLTSSRFSKTKRSTPRGPESSTSSDRVVQQTDDDAAGSRLSAVERGYFQDSFARAFASGVEGVRRMPIINRGTYVRTRAIDALITRFLSTTSAAAKTPDASTASTPTQSSPPQPPLKQSQIISLGAGTDTRPFRLFSRDPSLTRSLKYHELDFAATTAKKVALVDRTPELRELVSSPNSEYHVAENGASLKTACYEVTAVDLRDLASTASTSTSTSTPTAASEDAGKGIPSNLDIDPTVPMLILSECCLTYLPAATSTAILNSLVRRLSPSARVEVVLYEPLEPADAFGRTMVANLAGRGIAMPGMEAFPSLEKQKERLQSVLAGSAFSSAASEGSTKDTAMHVEVQAWTTKEVWDSWVSGMEKDRLRSCEMVDEEEEWVLLAGHYGVIWGCRRGAEEKVEGMDGSRGLVIDSGG